jgi:NADH dehydrogenase (ubiquinone) 1 beta subcomplex subunit 5
MGGMTHSARPSRWTYDKLKDDIHFYVLLAAVPLGIFTIYMNVTVGEAKLVPVPEGYKPKEWEYYKNPISRLMVKYIKPWSLQQEYEMNLHGVWEGTKIAEMRALKMEVQRQQAIHGDYKGWYHKEDIAHYARMQRAGHEANMNQGVRASYSI